MGPTRFPYGQALGFANQFSFTNSPVQSGTAGNISGNSTPNVTLGNLFYTNNTGALSISNLLLDDTANRITQYEGKVIKIFCIDSATTLLNAGNLFLQTTAGMAANSSIDLMFSRGNWYEIDRTLVTRNEFVSTRVGTAASVTIDNGTKAILFQSTSAASQLKAISGGYIGQTVTILSPAALNSGGITAYVMTGGNIIFPGTNMVAIQTNAGLQVTLVAANDWRYCQPGTAGLIN